MLFLALMTGETELDEFAVCDCYMGFNGDDQKLADNCTMTRMIL